MRRILVLTHTGRREAVGIAIAACEKLKEAGLSPVMRADEAAQIRAYPHSGFLSVEVLGRDVQLDDIELGMVLGGDGTILRTAELVRGSDVPLLGVNLGHVGFLAESDKADLDSTVTAILNRDYTVEERMTIDVQVWFDGARRAHTWALNEAAVEKADRERMIEVVVEVDGSPISTFGCDGVVMATPTGSTAYAFSSGGPIVWPEVQALVMAPISAHALFARPLVVAPESTLAVEVLTRTEARGVLWCDGRRMVDLPAGSRVEVTRSDHPVRLARLTRTPFANRLVRKFQLPISGWRGPAETAANAPTTALPVVGPVNVVEPPRNLEPLLRDESFGPESVQNEQGETR
ncbi:MAG: NAD kinase [Galactobacter sp.]